MPETFQLDRLGKPTFVRSPDLTPPTPRTICNGGKAPIFYALAASEDQYATDGEIQPGESKTFEVPVWIRAYDEAVRVTVLP
jgi:hypothetical protein